MEVNWILNLGWFFEKKKNFYIFSVKSRQLIKHRTSLRAKIDEVELAMGFCPA